MEAFCYDDLDLNRPTFRLVRLLKGVADDPRCEIFQASFDQREHAISYEALSYTWGSMHCTERIWLDGKELHVTSNLRKALRYLQLKECDRVLWVDALCINQWNNDEKSHQVRQMGDIYRTAERVVVWLGLPTYDTNVTIDTLQVLYEQSNETALRSKDAKDPAWSSLWAKVKSLQREKYDDLDTTLSNGLSDLLSRPWFDRVWVLQEVANAQSAIIQCGTRSVASGIFAMTPKILSVPLSSHCQEVLAIMPGLGRKDSWWSGEHDLYTLLSHFSQSQAQRPQDLVYALFPMSSDAQNVPELYPDYNKTERQVLDDLFKFLFSRKMSDEVRKRVVSIKQLATELERVTEFVFEEHLKTSDALELDSFLGRYDIPIREKHLELAAQNKRVDTFSLIFDVCQEFTHVSAKMLEASFRTTRDPIQFLETLLHKARWQIEITTDLLNLLVYNSPLSSALVHVMLRNNSTEEAFPDFLQKAQAKGVEEVARVVIRACVTGFETLDVFFKSLAKIYESGIVSTDRRSSIEATITTLVATAPKRLHDEMLMLSDVRSTLINESLRMSEKNQSYEGSKRLLEEPTRFLDKMTKIFDETRIVFDEQERQFNEQKRQFDEQRRRFHKRTRRLDKHRRLFNEERRQLDEERRRLDKQTRQFYKQRRLFDKHRRSFNEERRRCDEQTRLFDEQRRWFDEQRRRFDER
jgi:hypothetical protein